MGKKYCKKCDTDKDLKYFGKRRDTKDGLTLYCKSCLNKRRRAYCKTNRDKINAINNKYRKATDYNKNYTEAHRETINKNQRRSYHKHRVARRKKMREAYKVKKKLTR